MPCMQTPHPHLPLTPPEYISTYSGCAGVPMKHQQYAVGSQAVAVPEKGGYEFKIMSYPQSSHAYHPQHVSSYSGLPPPGITHPGGQYYQSNPSSGGYPAQNVELPPIIDIDDSFRARQHRHESRKQEAASATEAPVGGVAQHLDYEIDEMSNFVAAVSYGLVYGSALPETMAPTGFRKFVFQILSSTRLPSSTIFLGLVYLRERINIMPSSLARHDIAQRMLTVALLLASKFLDDNTFQNKSWSEVTHIPVLELNTLEREWLEGINWILHVDTEGTKGFSQYKDMWERWGRTNNVKAVSTPALALTPLNTNLRVRMSQNTFAAVAPYPAHQQQFTPPHSNVMSHRSIQLPPPRPTPPHDTGYWWSPPQDSPPSAPHSGPPTPEGYFGWGASFTPQEPTIYSRLPPIMPTYPSTHHPWAATRCACWQCQKPGESFFMPNYAQPVPA